MKKTIISLLMLLCFAATYAQETIGQVTQGISVLESSLWPNKTCAGCWENAMAANAMERGSNI